MPAFRNLPGWQLRKSVPGRTGLSPDRQLRTVRERGDAVRGVLRERADRPIQLWRVRDRLRCGRNVPKWGVRTLPEWHDAVRQPLRKRAGQPELLWRL